MSNWESNSQFDTLFSVNSLNHFFKSKRSNDALFKVLIFSACKRIYILLTFCIKLLYNISK